MNAGVVSFLVCVLLCHVGSVDSSCKKRGKKFSKWHPTICAISISQKAHKQCKVSRGKELLRARMFYKYSGADAELKIPLLGQSKKTTLAYFMFDKFHSHWFNLYFHLLLKQSSTLVTPFFKQKYLGAKMRSYGDYLKISKEMREAVLKAVNYLPYFKYASKSYKYFTDVTLKNRFRSDDYFAEERLAGMNPMTIRRVVNDDENGGTKIGDLLKRLNKKFNWEAAVTAVTKDRDIDESITKKKVYVVEFPMLNGLKAMPDKLGFEKPTMKMMLPIPPIGIFAVNRKKQLKVVAIQESSTPSGKVNTPKDGIRWDISKAQLQNSDAFVEQFYQHLLKTHIKMEPLCISMNRHLSHLHPLHQVLKYHCRGLLAVNSNGVPSLFSGVGVVRHIFNYGSEGAKQLVMTEYPKMVWNDVDLEVNIRERGMGDKKQMPYYPYRDDGRRINRVLGELARRLTHLLYRWDSQVKNDMELQNLIKEASTKIKGLPTQFRTKRQLSIFLRQIFWIIVQHSIVNFPVSEFGATPVLFTPKIYESRVAGSSQSYFKSLPGPVSAVLQSTLAFHLGTLHYDSLFDYWKELASSKLRRVVLDAYAELQQVNREIDYENRKRFKKGQLTNPYMLPSWMPNSIST